MGDAAPPVFAELSASPPPQLEEKEREMSFGSAPMSVGAPPPRKSRVVFEREAAVGDVSASSSSLVLLIPVVILVIITLVIALAVHMCSGEEATNGADEAVPMQKVDELNAPSEPATPEARRVEPKRGD